MNDFFSELKRRIGQVGHPMQQDPCLEPLLAKYAASTRVHGYE